MIKQDGYESAHQIEAMITLMIGIYQISSFIFIPHKELLDFLTVLHRGSLSSP